jgi:hypothetical protein
MTFTIVSYEVEPVVFRRTKYFISFVSLPSHLMPRESTVDCYGSATDECYSPHAECVTSYGNDGDDEYDVSNAESVGITEKPFVIMNVIDQV